MLAERFRALAGEPEAPWSHARRRISFTPIVNLCTSTQSICLFFIKATVVPWLDMLQHDLFVPHCFNAAEKFAANRSSSPEQFFSSITALSEANEIETSDVVRGRLTFRSYSQVLEYFVLRRLCGRAHRDESKREKTQKSSADAGKPLGSHRHKHR